MRPWWLGQVGREAPESGRDKLPKFGFQLLESLLEHFPETVFDQIDLIHLHLQCLGDLGGRDLLDRLEKEYLVVLRAGLLFHLFQRRVHDVLFPFVVPNGFKRVADGSGT